MRFSAWKLLSYEAHKIKQTNKQKHNYLEGRWTKGGLNDIDLYQLAL